MANSYRAPDSLMNVTLDFFLCADAIISSNSCVSDPPRVLGRVSSCSFPPLLCD
jgi:hypothetical protein